MEFREALHKVLGSSIFKEWKASHKTTYLSYGFLMKDPNVKEEWQIGYYNPSTDKITTFSVSDNVQKNPESEIFKTNKKVNKLDVTKVKISAETAFNKADTIQKDKYAAFPPIKQIMILQHLKEGQVWNITMISRTFKTLNIKVDAQKGNIVKHELIDMFKIEH